MNLLVRIQQEQCALSFKQFSLLPKKMSQNFPIFLDLDGAMSRVIKKNKLKSCRASPFCFFLQCRVPLFCKEEFTLEPNIRYQLGELSNNRFMAFVTKVGEVRLVY
jgi:hypothetical protein